MATSTATKQDVRPVIFETALSKDTSPYFLEDGFLEGRRQKIAHGGMEKIPWYDSIIETDKDGNEVSRVIRHIAACKRSIYQDEQIKMGFPENYRQEFKGALRGNKDDIIYINNGVITVDSRTQKNTLEYLRKCNFNGSNPNRDTRVQILFYFRDVVDTAKKSLASRTATDKAHHMINQLEGDTRKQGDIARLFNIDLNLTEPELLLKLHDKADQNPDLILNAMNDDKATAAIIAHKAEEFGVMEFTGFSYQYTGTQDKIKGFSGRQKQEEAFKKLVAFLQSDEGQIHYENLKKLIEAKGAN